MKRFLLILPFAALTAACVEANPGTVGGATVGAIAGAAIDDDDRVRGAVTGAVVGGVAGTLLGRSQQNPAQCVYQDRYGNRYVAACP
ncbi:MAG: glycine zipper 2TM domain-containing protein [Rhodobacteraceae bacterium]|nr:glycine zipper 2TM domain-containing protein [Paracoccaceae bacterium]